MSSGGAKLFFAGGRASEEIREDWGAPEEQGGSWGLASLGKAASKAACLAMFDSVFFEILPDSERKELKRARAVVRCETGCWRLS